MILVFNPMKDFKADFGFDKPKRTKSKCENPEFADPNYHRIAIMKDFHVGDKGDKDEGGIKGWVSKRICTGCNKEFYKGNGFFYQD
jgi:hypothetical protein